MERTKKVNAENTEEVKESKPLWKKVGGGSLRMGNRIIKPGQIFEAYPEEISPAFRNVVIPQSEGAIFREDAPKGVPPVAGIKPVYKLQPHGKSLFLFDIVDADGKVLNEKSLKRDVAEKLIQDLQR